MTSPDDPRLQREADLEAGETGLNRATIASIAFILLLFGAVAMWAYYSHDGSPITSAKRQGVEQTMPPATTGQGGAASKMPTAKDGR